jgi:hypothetical protein
MIYILAQILLSEITVLLSFICLNYGGIGFLCTKYGS